MTQIYLPSPDFKVVAKCLDQKRLCKQITEAKQVYTQNKYGFGGQGNKKPYEMWMGYENALGLYICELYKEWQRRFVDSERGGSIFHKAGEYIINDIDLSNGVEMPHWIDDKRVFSSYRSALLYKDFQWYSQFGWEESPAVPLKIVKGIATLPYFYREGKPCAK